MGRSWGEGRDWRLGGEGFRRSKDQGRMLGREGESFTIEKVPLAFQDLSHLLDPGLTDRRVCSLQDIALDPTLWPSGGQCKAARVALEVPLQSQAAHLDWQIRGSPQILQALSGSCPLQQIQRGCEGPPSSQRPPLSQSDLSLGTPSPP